MSVDKEALLDLAIQSIHDADARPVLADAIIESGWWNENYMHVFAKDASSIAEWGASHRYQFIAAVLMFEDFPNGIVVGSAVHRCWSLEDWESTSDYTWVNPVGAPLNFYRLTIPAEVTPSPLPRYLTLADRIRIADE